ncbi:MAG TPA: EscU/YscU/HrcU family type III secretion system export apparatus switch protein [Candidatus Acidoferrales bacterium]|nr:EscU/YscU/HrcU family type III secretion system export apparatus switch protein [Candidatus Acidoferrales bacterium]
MADNRTEQATPRRRQQAREKGQVLRSRDLVSAFTFLSVVLLFAWQPEAWIGRWHTYFSHTLAAGALTDWTSQTPVIAWTGLTVAQWVGPIFATAFFAAVASTLAQGGLNIATEALTPNWSRLNPANNVRQLFSLAGVSRTLRSLLPSSMILFLALRLVWNEAPTVLHSSRLHSRGTLALMGQLCFSIAWQSGLVLLAWSGVDYLLQKQTFERSLRMTKQEVKQETKDTEGNPQVKGRMRRLRRELLRRVLQKDVQKATAVITNPTHYAVAIEYRPATMAAPVVVAKGRNLLAQKIKELARWHEIPIVENPPLAQALYKAADVGQMIPPKLYAAVAEILAFLYRAQMRMKTAANRAQARPAGAR